MTDAPMKATITKNDRWDQFAHVERVEWIIALTGGPFDGQTKTTRTRRDAREWCDEFGYDWKDER